MQYKDRFLTIVLVSNSSENVPKTVAELLAPYDIRNLKKATEPNPNGLVVDRGKIQGSPCRELQPDPIRENLWIVHVQCHRRLVWITLCRTPRYMAGRVLSVVRILWRIWKKLKDEVQGAGPSGTFSRRSIQSNVGVRQVVGEAVALSLQMALHERE